MWRTLAEIAFVATVLSSPALANPTPPARAESAGGSKPANVAGCWDLVVKMPFLHPNLHGRLSLAVERRSLRGTVTLHGDELPLREGTIDDDRIRFAVERSGETLAFGGALKRAELRGTMTKAGKRHSWSAVRCPPT